jgi:integrase
VPYLRKLEHVTKDGKKVATWQSTIRLANGKRRSETFPLKTQARDWGLEEEARIRRGDWRDPRLSRTTVEDWHRRWRAARVVEPETDRGDKAGHERILDEWAGEILTGVGRLEVQAWIKRMESAQIGKAAIRRTYNLFRAMINSALDEGLIVADPTRNITLPAMPKKLPRFFTHEQAAAILAEMREPHRTFADLMLWCGLRWGEAAGLRACDVIWLRKRISIVGVTRQDGTWKEYPKNSASRAEIPAPAHILDALSVVAAGADGDDLLFRTKRGNAPFSGPNWLTHWWYPAIDAANERERERARSERRKAAPIPRYSPHKCRHTAASWLVQDSVPIYDVQRIMRHASVSTTQIYAHLAPDGFSVVTSSWDRMVTLSRRSDDSGESGTGGLTSV